MSPVTSNSRRSSRPAATWSARSDGTTYRWSSTLKRRNVIPLPRRSFAGSTVTPGRPCTGRTVTRSPLMRVTVTGSAAAAVGANTRSEPSFGVPAGAVPPAPGSPTAVPAPVRNVAAAVATSTVRAHAVGRRPRRGPVLRVLRGERILPPFRPSRRAPGRTAGSTARPACDAHRVVMIVAMIAYSVCMRRVDSGHAQQVHDEDERLAWTDGRAGSAPSVGEVRRDDQLAAAACAHSPQAQLPALDHSARSELELERFARSEE